MWGDITADMMTEEETGSENNYIRRRQSWRSTKFNQLMDQLDEDKSNRSLAKQRELGDVIVRTPPQNVKHWMITDQTGDEEPEEIEGDNELSSAEEISNTGDNQTD